jgi:hypothetical protein
MLHRQFQSHDFWRERRVFSRAEAWIDIIMSARWQDDPGEVRIGNVLLLCGRGEVLYSMQTWAARWSWTESKVKRFLHSLAANRNSDCKRTMIELSNERVTTRIKICNYEAYQTARTVNEPETDCKRTANESQTTTTEEGKNSKKSKIEERVASTPSKFSNYWNQFKDVHSECSRVSEMRFVDALRACAVDQNPAVIESALADLERHYADLATFKPKTPLGAFEAYLKAALNPPGGVHKPSGCDDPRVVKGVFKKPRRPDLNDYQTLPGGSDPRKRSYSGVPSV